MKTYVIRRTEGKVKVSVHDGPGGSSKELTPAASQRIINHSPDGFEFGYGGSGPSQLALAIMLDFFQDRPGAIASADTLAFEHYQDFKAAFIATEQAPEFMIREEQIIRWHGSRISR